MKKVPSESLLNVISQLSVLKSVELISLLCCKNPALSQTISSYNCSLTAGSFNPPTLLPHYPTLPSQHQQF